MSINGIRNGSGVTVGPVAPQENQGTTPLVQTTSVPSGNGVLLSPATHGASSGDIPGPTQDPATELAVKQSQLEELTALREPCSRLARAGDEQAAQLLSEIDQIISQLEVQIARLEQGLSADTDGDGVSDLTDPDVDGDLITNAEEQRRGSNPFSTDSDGDGISDDNERRLRNLGEYMMEQGEVQEGRRVRRLGNALDADANHNGIVDGQDPELSQEIRVKIGMTGATGPSGNTEDGTSGAASQSVGSGNQTTTPQTPQALTPFEGVVAESDRTRNGARELVFDLTETDERVFRMTETVEGQEAKQWTLNADELDNLVVEAKNASGEVLARFIIKDGNQEEMRQSLEFRLANNGVRFDSTAAVKIRGGSGDDLIYSVASGDSRIIGGDGFDTIFVNGDQDGTFIDGGAGNDIIRGSDGTDRIEGGAGNDFIYGGRGDNTLIGGDGNDALFTANTSGETGRGETISGGTGLDLSNAFEGDISSLEMGIEDMNGLNSYLSQYGANGASAIEIQEILNFEDGEIPHLQEMIAEKLETLAIQFLWEKEIERQARYAPLPGASNFDPNAPAHPTTEPPNTAEEPEDPFFDNL